MAITVINCKITPYEQKSELSKLIFGDTWSITLKLPTPHVDGDSYVMAIDYERIVFPADHAVCAYSDDFTIWQEAQEEDLAMSVKLESSRLAKWLSELKKPTPMCVQIARLRNDVYETLLLDDILALPSIVNPEMYVDSSTPIGELISGKLDTPEEAGSAGQVLTLGDSGVTIWADAGAMSQQQADWTEADQDSPSYIKHKPTITTVNNGVLTIQQGGVSKGSFSANQNSNTTVSLDSPNNATISIVQGGVSKGSFTTNQSNNQTINIDAGETPNNATITIVQGGVSKGSFSVNQAENQTINIDAGGGTGSVSWGGISGTLSNQTDLQTALNGKQATITSTNKLDYDLISNTPTIPTVGSATLTITQNGVSKGTFNANATSNVGIEIAGENNVIEGVSFNGQTATISNKVAAITASIPTVNDPTITFTQGGVSKGSISLNQSTSQTIALDAGGGGGDGTLTEIYTSATELTVSAGNSYFWELSDVDATLSCSTIAGKDFDIPIDISISSSTITVSGITRVGTFINGFIHRCLITKRYDKTLLYIYSVESIS